MVEFKVVYESRIVGFVTVVSEDVTFRYSSEWLSDAHNFPVSLQMELGEGEYQHDSIMPWLMNLLPEGDQLSGVAHNLGVSPGDTIGLLEKIGHETAGALSFLPVDASLQTEKEPFYQKINSDAELEEILETLPQKPFLAGEAGVSMSLAGMQEKLPVFKNEKGLFIPRGGAASTHILKPDTKNLDKGIYNEAFCMTLARNIGLPVPGVETGSTKMRSWCLVERYDRIMPQGQERFPIRRHQEDFCQALGRRPQSKYEKNGLGSGISLSDMFGLIDSKIKGRAKLDFLNGVIFNLLITNVDSHAKNYSIILSGSAAPALAPLYDLMAGDVWPHITENMAQAIGGERRGRQVRRKHWKRMSEENDLSAGMVIGRVRHIGRNILAKLEKTQKQVRSMPAGDSYMIELVSRHIRERVNIVLTNLDA